MAEADPFPPSETQTGTGRQQKTGKRRLPRLAGVAGDQFLHGNAHPLGKLGQVFALVILTVAAAEAAIGLAILVVFFRNRGTIEVEDVNVMKG